VNPGSVVYRHLDGLITTRTRPSGGLICEIEFPSRTRPHEALPCILAAQMLLRDMSKELLKGLSYDEREQMHTDALRELLAVLGHPA
jgi:hypothetical protein